MPRNTRILPLFLRCCGVLIAAALLFWTIRRTGAAPLDALRSADAARLAAAFGLIGSTHLLGGFRWKNLLAVQGIRLTLMTLFKLTLLGNLFSQLIPGAVSGDVIKLAYIAKGHPAKGVEAILSALIDRIAGVAGLFLVATLGGMAFWLSHPESVEANRLLRTALLLVACGGLGCLLALTALVFHRALLHIAACRRAVTAGERILPQRLTAFCKRLCAASDAYASRKQTLLLALLTSMLIHFNLGMALFCIGRALGERDFPFAAYFFSTQVGNAVTLIPATPGGIGLRDTATAAIFQAFSSQETPLAGSIPVIYSILGVLWAAAGLWAIATLPGNWNAHTNCTHLPPPYPNSQTPSSTPDEGSART